MHRLVQDVERSALQPIARNPKAIPVPEKVLDLTRLAQAVKIFDANDSAQATVLSKLTSGTYVYLIDSRGRIAFMDRIVAPPSGKELDQSIPNVGSHEGLVAHLQSLGGDPVEVFAAGEVVVRDGIISIISNRSGSWRGGKASLSYAESRLKALGLPVRSLTRVLDYSDRVVPDPHQSVAQQVFMELRFRRNPVRRAILKDTQEVMTSVRQSHALEDRLVDAALSDSSDPAMAIASTYAAQFVEMWRKGIDGEAQIVHTYLGKLNEVEFRNMLEVIREAGSKP